MDERSVKMNDELKPAYNWKKDFKPFFIVFGAVVVVTFLFVMCNIPITKNNSLATPTTKNEQSQQIEALVGSQMVVENNLKSPSSAKLPLIMDSNVSVNKLSENKYFVSSYVDSENSFGAMIRTYYTCTVTLLSNNKYNVEDLQFVK